MGPHQILQHLKQPTNDVFAPYNFYIMGKRTRKAYKDAQLESSAPKGHPGCACEKVELLEEALG